MANTVMRGDDLRAELEALADEWRDAAVQMPSKWAAGRLRALLDAHPTPDADGDAWADDGGYGSDADCPTPSEPEATVVEAGDE